MSDDLFTSADEAKRNLLRSRGWTEAGNSTATNGTIGNRYWRSPAGPVLTEEEAFAWMGEAKK